MTTPRHPTACHRKPAASHADVLPTPSRLAAPYLLLLLAALCGGALPALAQDPVFRVPVLEDVDPDSVRFNDRIIERDRSQPGMGEPVQAPESNAQAGSAGGGGGAGGGSGASGRAPSVFQGGPRMPTASSGSGSDGGIDVNVSVSGQQLPSIMQGGGSAGSPGMPGPSGSSGAQDMPGSPGSSGGGSRSSDGDGGLDVNVNVTGGPQLPTLNIPGLPGAEGSTAGMPGASMPGMPGNSPGSSNGSASGSGTTSADGSMAGTAQGSGGAGSMPGGIPGASSSSRGNGTMAGTSAGSGVGTIGGGSGRAAVLDRRLEESFGVFDGMIIAEREKAQSEADAAGSSVMGTGGGGEGEGGEGEAGGTFGGAPEGTILVAGGPQSSTGGGVMPSGGPGREGEFSNKDQPTYPIPEDIPDGDDDDVVARQLREAAMSEPDPELREKLWDEYRKYTGLSQ